VRELVEIDVAFEDDLGIRRNFQIDGSRTFTSSTGFCPQGNPGDDEFLLRRAAAGHDGGKKRQAQGPVGLWLRRTFHFARGTSAGGEASNHLKSGP